VGTRKTLAPFLASWVPVVLVGWVAVGHPAELGAVVDSLMRTLGGA